MTISGRKAGARTGGLSEREHPAALQVAAPGLDPYWQCLLKEFADSVARLPEHMRRAIKLRQQGYSFGQTAEILNRDGIKCSKVSVRNWMLKALERSTSKARLRRSGRSQGRKRVCLIRQTARRPLLRLGHVYKFISCCRDADRGGVRRPAVGEMLAPTRSSCSRLRGGGGRRPSALLSSLQRTYLKMHCALGTAPAPDPAGSTGGLSALNRAKVVHIAEFRRFSR